MTWLVYSVFLVGPTVMNLSPRLLPALNVLGSAFNIGGFIIWAIVFLVMAPKNSAEFVFTKFINTSGWASPGWVFVLSFYVPIYGLYGTDGVMHLVEEMKHPARDAPVSLWTSFRLNAFGEPLIKLPACHGLVDGVGHRDMFHLCDHHGVYNRPLGDRPEG